MIDYDELCEFVDKRINPEPCPYWSDGQHMFTKPTEYDIRRSQGVQMWDKLCACGATVKPKGLDRLGRE